MSKNFENQYSTIEKILHKSACKSWSSQVSLSDIESRVFKKKLTGIEIKKPVFITALPRAGTTVLLELCVKSNEFASHTYRDMPFLLTPLFWNRFSKLFMRSAPRRERAHGDGIMINVDSPEAFEEIIWKTFWPSRYRKERIVPWSDTDYPVFEEFFKDHIRKIIFLRGNKTSPQLRYLSKNNLNISRTSYLKRIFPDSIILVPFREPLQHASSLLRQHRNFLKIHKEDSFASRYMEDIGHFDFGINLRPVDFGNWLSSEYASDSDTLEFWLQYWISTYRYLLRNKADHIKFISFDLFCKDPEKNLDQFGKILEFNNLKILREKVYQITPPTPYVLNFDDIPLEILDQSESLYMDLQKRHLK